MLSLMMGLGSMSVRNYDPISYVHVKNKRERKLDIGEQLADPATFNLSFSFTFVKYRQLYGMISV